MSLDRRVDKMVRNAKIVLGTLTTLSVLGTGGLIYDSIYGNIDGWETLKKTVTALAIPYGIYLPLVFVQYRLERLGKLRRNSREQPYEEKAMA